MKLRQIHVLRDGLRQQVWPHIASPAYFEILGYLVVTLPKLNYVPPKQELNSEVTAKNRRERLEVKSEREQQEMDFSRIVETNEEPPDLEPIEWGQNIKNQLN